MRRILFLYLFLLSVTGVYAADLGASVRLDSQKIGSSPLPILVTIKTSTAVIENNLNINIASGWTIDNNVTVSTSGLPTGLTPLPSISAGLGNGQNIGFTIGDLTIGVEYGFYITGGIGINPMAGTKTWTVSTNGNSVDVGVAILNSDQVVVTGRVGAKASDFQLNLSADKSGNLKENEIVTYQIEYGTYLLGAVKPLVITGTWSRGTVVGSPSPSVDIVDYVVGSGTTGWGGAEPVIDLVNRKIVWTITSFPANTVNQNVSFKLQINNSYSGSSNVTFDVSAILDGANVVTVDSVLNQTFEPTILPSPTPTSGPTPTSSGSTTNLNTSATTISATPTPTTIGLRINKIEIASLEDDKASIMLAVNKTPSQLKINYGESANKLSKSYISLNNTKLDQLILNDLKPETNYFFRIKVTTGSGEMVNSEIYTFRTAKLSNKPTIDPKSVIVSVANNIILDADNNSNYLNSVILLPNINYALRLKMSQPELIKHARIVVRNTQVLGINTVYGAEPNAVTVDLLEVENGGFLGHLVSPNQLGYYDLLIRVDDENGNIIEDKVGQLRIVNPMVVADSRGFPIENAKVTISRFNEKKKIYEQISANFLGMKNPNYTEVDGKLMVNFIAGKYQVEVKDIGYQSKEVGFDVGWGESEVMPIITLDKEKFSWVNIGEYYWSIILNVWSYTGKYVENLSLSGRFFKLMSGMILLLSIVVLNKYLTKKQRLAWWMTPFWLIGFLQKKSRDRVYGKVIDNLTSMPIAGAEVYIMDGVKNKIINKTTTNVIGEFEMMVTKIKMYKLIVKKSGYETTNILDYTFEGLLSESVLIEMENEVGKFEAVEIASIKFINKLIWFGITMLLVLILFVEISFVGNFGLISVGPWLVLDCLLLWGWVAL